MNVVVTARWLVLTSLFALATSVPLSAQIQPRLGDLTVEGVSYTDDQAPASYTLTIKGRQMRMDQGGISMILRPTGDRPGILFLHHEEKRVDFMPADLIAEGERAMSAESVMRHETAPEPLPGMETLAAVPESVTIVENGSPRTVQVDLERVGFHYEGEADVPGFEPAALPADIRDMLTVLLTVETRAAVDPDIEGAAVIAAFYDEAVKSGLGAPSSNPLSMVLGLMAVNREMASVGFPVWVGSKTNSKVKASGPAAGMVEGMLGNMPGMLQALSVSVVETISTDPVDPALFYGGGMPEGYEVHVMDTSGAGS